MTAKFQTAQSGSSEDEEYRRMEADAYVEYMRTEERKARLESEMMTRLESAEAQIAGLSATVELMLRVMPEACPADITFDVSADIEKNVEPSSSMQYVYMQRASEISEHIPDILAMHAGVWCILYPPTRDTGAIIIAANPKRLPEFALLAHDLDADEMYPVCQYNGCQVYKFWWD